MPILLSVWLPFGAVFDVSALHKSLCFKREIDLSRKLGCFEPGTEAVGLPRCIDAGFVTIGTDTGVSKVHGYITMQLMGRSVVQADFACFMLFFLHTS